MSELPRATASTVRDLDRARVRAELRSRMFGAEDLGVHIGRFRLLRKLGSGATDMVFAASDPTLGRQVAVKVLMTGGDQQAALTEARALRAAGLSLRKVAAALDARGLRARNGGTFAASQVARMVAA